MMLPNNTIQLFLSCIITFTSVLDVNGNADDDDDEKYVLKERKVVQSS